MLQVVEAPRVRRATDREIRRFAPPFFLGGSIAGTPRKAPASRWQATAIANCEFSYDGVNLGADTTLISTWSDSSGKGRDLTASGGARPTVKANAVSGQKAAVLDGVANYLKTASFSVPQPLTIIAVLKQVAHTNGGAILEDNSAGEPLGIDMPNTSPNVNLWASTTAAPVATELTIGSYGILQCVFNGASSTITVGTHTTHNGNPGAGGISHGIILGAYNNGSSSFTNIEVAWCSGWSRALSGGEISTAVAALTGIYGAGV